MTGRIRQSKRWSSRHIEKSAANVCMLCVHCVWCVMCAMCVVCCMCMVCGVPLALSDPLAGPATEFEGVQCKMKMQPPCSEIHGDSEVLSLVGPF